jgi:uncharacterized lipoprotein YddW (UPF0748 family)
MTGCFRAVIRMGLCWMLVGCGFSVAAQNQPAEFRALWVDTFHSGIKSSTQITTLVNDLRAGNFNAVIPEVRKRGDAYYQSNYEPEASDMTSADSLAELITKAHNTNGGAARIEVHPWIVTFNIWNNQTTAPAEADHPYNLHPDWLTENDGGAQWDGGNYAFDPGHPEVQRHTFNVCMDIITNYDVDGFNFDYIRYAGTAWGYNPVAVARFNRIFGRSGQPSRSDAAWLQFRRDQVTALVRKVYLSTMAIKPHVKISADTITWAPGPTSDLSWTNSSAAYTSVLQDWRSWMQEGMLDLNIPMAYFRQNTHPTDYANWINFARDRAFNRHVVIGPGIYLNSLSNSLIQMRMTRIPTGGGNVAHGICGYSYAVPTSNNLARSTFLAALTQTNTSRLYETNTQPIFATRVPTPNMPWKTAPTRGHLKGFVYGGSTTNPLDRITVTVTGTVQRTTFTDATGFYGFVDLPPGNYGVSSTSPMFGSARSNFVVTVGFVSTADLLLTTNDMAAPVIGSVTVTQVTNTSARINWITDEPANTIVDYGASPSYGLSVTNPALASVHSQPLNSLSPATTYHFRVRSRDAQGNLATSGDFSFTTLASPPIIIAHPESQTVRAGSNALFSVTATGTAPLSYQWRFNGVDIDGATSSTFTRAMSTGNDSGTYSVLVTNIAGMALSSNATLMVSIPMAPMIREISLLADQRVRLLISSDPGYPVQVQGSPNLTEWSELATFMNTNGTAIFIDVPGTNGQKRYFRVEGQ